MWWCDCRPGGLIRTSSNEEHHVNLSQKEPDLIVPDLRIAPCFCFG